MLVIHSRNYLWNAVLVKETGAVFTVLSIGGGNVKIKSTIISKLGHYHLDDVWYFEIHVQKYIFRMKKSSFAKLLNPKDKLLIVLLLHASPHQIQF